MRTVWISKGTWKKPGPVAYMGLLNAFSFAWNDIETDFFVNSPGNVDINTDLEAFYGLTPHPRLTIHPVSAANGIIKRAVYKTALHTIRNYCDNGEDVLVLTREVGILPALLRLKRRYPHLKVVHEVHDYYGSVKHLPRRSASDYRRMLSERMTFAGLDGLLCLTEYQRALYQQWLPDLPMVTLPLGSAKPGQAPADAIEKRRQYRRVAYIGHLHSYKGLELILKLAAALHGTGIQVACYGGPVQQVSELTAQANSRGLSENLSFTPFLSPRELDAILANEISIGIVPLQDTYYSRYLTCPVKALDFMAQGLPVVGSDVPSVKEVLDNSGIIIPGNQEAAYAEAIVALLDNEQRYNTFSQQALKRASAINWEKRALAIVNFVRTDLQ